MKIGKHQINDAEWFKTLHKAFPNRERHKAQKREAIGAGHLTSWDLFACTKEGAGSGPDRAIAKTKGVGFLALSDECSPKNV